jgi:phospholipase C
LHHTGDMSGMTRRQALRLLGLGGLAMMGCKTAAAGAEDGAQSSDFSSSCAADRLRSSLATSPEALRRYDHIVVLMMENRSFDHYFGHLSMPTSMGGEGRKDVDGLKGNEVQYLYGPNGEIQQTFPIFHAGTRKLGDIGHGWDDCHMQFNNGGMNGFIQAHAIDLAKGDGADCGHHCGALGDPMAYYKREDTPVLHELFDNYALCDRWFASVMGPTWPNRFYLHAGTSMGIKTNDKMDTDSDPDDPGETRTIWHEMRSKCLEAVNYSMDFAWNLGGFGMFNSTPTRSVFKQNQPNNDRGPGSNPPESFEEACENGTLPSVSVIDPAFIFAPCDDHPPHDIKSGQAFISSIYKLLTKNPRVWEKTLFIVTYDEHGSFYDHVAPPVDNAEERPEFKQLGFRVPSLIIGPGVKRNYVSHVQYDHTSFLSTVTRRFGLSPLNGRVAAANDFSDCIDLNAAGTLHTPSPVALQSVLLKESIVHESIRESLGQDELARIALGRPATLEEKRRATDQMLAAYDRLGVASIR